MYKSYSNSQPKLYNNDLPGLLIQTNHKNDILHDCDPMVSTYAISTSQSMVIVYVIVW